MSVTAVCALRRQLLPQAAFLRLQGALLAYLLLAALCWAQPGVGLSLPLPGTRGYSSAPPSSYESKCTWKSACATELDPDTLSLGLSGGFTNYLVPARNKHKWETAGLWITSLNFPPQISSFPTARRGAVPSTGGVRKARVLAGTARSRGRRREAAGQKQKARKKTLREQRDKVTNRKGGIYGNGKKEGRKGPSLSTE